VDAAVLAINKLILECKQLPVRLPKDLLTDDPVVREELVSRLTQVAGWRVSRPTQERPHHYELSL
jgi:hypothetical protein